MTDIGVMANNFTSACDFNSLHESAFAFHFWHNDVSVLALNPFFPAPPVHRSTGFPLPPKRGVKESLSFAPLSVSSLSFAQRTYRTRVYERISNRAQRAYIESSGARYIDDFAPSALDMCFALDMSSGLDMQACQRHGKAICRGGPNCALRAMMCCFAT